MSHLIAVAFELLVAFLVGLIAYRLVSGQTPLRGLLETRPSGGVDAERVQMLVVWLGGVGAFASRALASGAGATGALPEFPEYLVAGLTGSQLFYLVGKYVRYQRR